MTNIFDIVSNVKVMESIGYASTEGLGDNLKQAGKKLVEKVKEIIKKIKQWIKRVIDHIVIGFIKFINYIKSKFIKLKGCLCKEDLQKIKLLDDPSNKSNDEEKIKEIDDPEIKKCIYMIKLANEFIPPCVEKIRKYKTDHNYRDDLQFEHFRLKDYITSYLNNILNIVKYGFKIPHLDEKIKRKLRAIDKEVYDTSLPYTWTVSDYWNKVNKIIDLNNNNQYEYQFDEIKKSLESFKEWRGITEDEKRL